MAAADLPASSHTRRNVSLLQASPHQKPKDFLAPRLRRRSYPCFEQGLTEWCTNDGVFQEMHQKCVICEAWNQSKYLIWATFVKQLSSFRGLSRLLRTLVCKNCSNEPRLTQYFYPLGNFGASPPSQPRISHSELHVPTTLLLVPLSGRSLELHFVRHEPVPSLQFRPPFGYLNLITNSIFGPGLSAQNFPIISCNRIAGAELQSVWVGEGGDFSLSE